MTGLGIAEAWLQAEHLRMGREKNRFSDILHTPRHKTNTCIKKILGNLFFRECGACIRTRANTGKYC